MQFCMENLKMKRKRTKFFLTLWSGDFLIFPPMIWIFMEGKCDGIKSRQPAKIFPTLNLFLDASAEILLFPSEIS